MWDDDGAADWSGECNDDGRSIFADPGGRSALRAASASNPRNLPCPTCKRRNMLTRADKARGYQCDICADRTESGCDMGDCDDDDCDDDDDDDDCDDDDEEEDYVATHLAMGGHIPDEQDDDEQDDDDDCDPADPRDMIDWAE